MEKIIKESPTRLIQFQRKPIFDAAENGCYEVVIRYDLTEDKIQILRDLGFTVDKHYDYDGRDYKITWDKPQKPKDEIPDMEEEAIEYFNAVKMHMRAKEINAATLREFEKRIAPLRNNASSDTDTVLLDRDLSNRINMSPEVRKSIIRDGFDLSIDGNGRFTVCWNKQKVETREQQEDEGNNDFLKEVLAKIRRSAATGFFNVDVPVCSDADIYEKTMDELMSLGYSVKKIAFSYFVDISWYKPQQLFNKNDSKILNAYQARNMAIDSNKDLIKLIADDIKDVQDEKCGHIKTLNPQELPPIAKKVLNKHGVNILEDPFSEDNSGYISWSNMIENALNDMVTDELLM